MVKSLPNIKKKLINFLTHSDVKMGSMKIVLITGVSRGIGRATAEKFLAERWQVVGTSTSGKANWTHRNMHLYQMDLSAPESIAKLEGEVKKDGKKLDVLINNAAIQIDPSDNSINITVLRRTLEVNLVGTIDLTQRLLPVIADGGKIVNVTSALSELTNFFMVSSPDYQISKTGLNMFTKILAEQLKKRKITVLSFEPGWVKTDLGGENAPRKPTEPADEIFELVKGQAVSGCLWGGGKRKSW